MISLLKSSASACISEDFTSIANDCYGGQLAGVSPGEGTGATMSDDEDDQADSDPNLYDGSLDGPDSLGFGPLVPTESERSLMERVRQELKHELKQVGRILHSVTLCCPDVAVPL